MSAAGLDMSLDEIIAKKKPSRGNRSGGPTRGGGIAKRSGGPVRNTRSSLARSRPYAATSTATNISASPEGKILVSNLAYKVSEADLWTFVRKFLSSTALLRLVALVPGESEIFSTTFSNPNNLIAPSENKPPDRYQTLLHTRTSTPLIPLQHQELFQTMIGPVRQVNLNFDQSGRSKGGSRRADNRPKKTQEELDAEMSEYMQIDEDSSQAADSATAP
ncbi:13291_t:CDS:2, partial [Racocetra fulgida]